MAHVKTERLPNERIIISTYSDHVTLEDVQQSSRAVEPILRAMGSGVLYYILDVRNSNATFKDILDILRRPDDTGEMEAAAHGFVTHLMMVGSAALAKFYVQAAQQQQYGNMQIPLFATLETAIDAARTGLALAHSRQPLDSSAAAD